MRLAAANTAAAGCAYRDGSGELTRAAIPQARELADHLVERGIDVVRELDLGDRLQSIDTHADRGRHDPALRDRRIEYAMLPILSLQAVGDTEDAAEIADILA